MGARVKLAVNGWRMHGPSTGIGRYLRGVVCNWTPDVLRPRFDDVTVYSHRPLDGTETTLPPGIRERVLGPGLPLLVWENVRLGPAVDAEVLFCPSYTRPLRTRPRTVVAIHDATCQLYPRLYSRAQPLYNRLYGWSARHSTLVLTSTEAARRDIARVWAVPPERIRVVPLAPAGAFKPLHEDSAKRVGERLLGSPAPYFLFVGKSGGRRRVSVMVEALAAFKEARGAPHKLILVGPSPSEETAALAARHDVADDVHHAGFVPDEDLNALYNGAEALVCPSVYETVSLPMLEAHAAGAPIVCVDTPGSRETTRGAAVFFPDITPAHVAEALGRLAGDNALRMELREAGLACAGTLSWARTASETLDVLEEAVTLPTDATMT